MIRTTIAALGLLLTSATSFAQDEAAPATSTAIFAGGCFWCTESDFEKVPGVLKAISGYIGGHQKNPDYRDVSRGTTGHTEAVAVVFDPSKVSYAQLVEHFWVTIDPTVKDRQFCDTGSQYRSGIFYLDEEQKLIAQTSKAKLQASKRLKGAKVVTEITKADVFYEAEEYHQDYYKKNAVRYSFYRTGCGRDRRLKQLWGDAAAVH